MANQHRRVNSDGLQAVQISGASHQNGASFFYFSWNPEKGGAPRISLLLDILEKQDKLC